MEDGRRAQVTPEAAMAQSVLNSLVSMAQSGAYEEEEYDEASRAELYYEGTDEEDFEQFRKDFENQFTKDSFGKARPRTGDKYADELAFQQYKCVEFMACCGGRAANLAKTNYQQLLQAEEDSPHQADDAPPKTFFESFVRSIKNALGPPDSLVYWLQQSQGVELRSLTAEGFEAYLSDIMSYLQRVVSAKADILQNLAFQVQEGRLAGGLDLGGGDDDDDDENRRDVNAISRHGLAFTPIPRAALGRKRRQTGRRGNANNTLQAQQRQLAHEQAQMGVLREGLESALRKSVQEQQAGARTADSLDRQNGLLMERLDQAEARSLQQQIEVENLRDLLQHEREVKISGRNAVTAISPEGENLGPRERDSARTRAHDTVETGSFVRRPEEQKFEEASDTASYQARRTDTSVLPARRSGEVGGTGALARGVATASPLARRPGQPAQAFEEMDRLDSGSIRAPHPAELNAMMQLRRQQEGEQSSLLSASDVSSTDAQRELRLETELFALSAGLAQDAEWSEDSASVFALRASASDSLKRDRTVTPSRAPFLHARQVPVHPDPHSLWNRDSGAVEVLVLGEEGGGPGGGRAKEEAQIDLLREYVNERSASMKAERKILSSLANCGLSVQQPLQDPTLADLDIDNHFVCGIITNGVRRFSSAYVRRVKDGTRQHAAGNPFVAG
jgi:hypothetical protein